MLEISQQARQILADAYDADKKPWFAAEIRKGWSKQFDVSLRAIENLLNQKPVKYCTCNLPKSESMYLECKCS